ncbi:MAG: T9SS type A sorting domain-containing protein [bacterium]
MTNKVKDGAFRKSAYLLLAGFLFLAVALSQAFGAGKDGALSFGKVAANKEITEKLELAKANEMFLQGVKAHVEQAKMDEIFRQKMRDFPVEQKMAAYVKAIDNAMAQGVDLAELTRRLKSQRDLLQSTSAVGSIAGTVTIEGAAPTGFVEVVAFTVHGFPAGHAMVDAAGNYSIVDLPAADYRVLTHSRYVDEFFDDVPLNGFRNWRDATLVTVPEGGEAGGIDFDLLQGATVSGHIFQADGTTPIGSQNVHFAIFRVDPFGLPREVDTVTDADGAYTFNLPTTGMFKIAALVAGFLPEFFDNKPDFESADVVDIPTLDTELTNIDFSLEAAPDAPQGAAIAGTVTGPSGPLFLSFVFAFNVADTTIQGLGVSDVFGEYIVEGLDAGDYVVYADNFTSFLSPDAPGVRGEYFDDAPTSDLATPVTAVDLDTIPDIDFELDTAGGISGTITDDAGTALDSVLVIAVRVDAENLGKFFFDAIDFGVAFSDASGTYTITGLSPGPYILRTVSLLTALLSGDVPLEEMVIDEYYDNVQSIFDLDQATPVEVTVPETHEGIDFVLDRAGAISGRFVEATDGVTPIVGTGLVFAFNVETGLPEIAFPVFDSTTGEYVVAPLPSGTFVLLGLVVPADTLNPQDLVLYLPQFYDGAATPEEATPVLVTAPVVTPDIDFNMVRAGSIEGFVNIAPGFPVGADSLSTTFVVAYEATSGAVAGGAETTFSGGFKIFGLPPGSYKVAALPVAPAFSVTYHGGGTTFDAANSTPVAVTAGAATVADINLATALGVIRGMVTNLDGSVPLNGVLVLAYDGTGHVVSAGLSGFPVLPPGQLAATTLSAGSASQPGEYFIPGLGTGTYYVRTFSLFQIFLLLEQLDLAGDLGGDPLALLFGLLDSGDDLLGQLNIELFADLYYPDQIVVPDLAEFDLFSFLFRLLLGGGDPASFIPFADNIPSGAGEVTVTSPGIADGIDFHLPRLLDVISDVETPDGGMTLPTAFQLSQNYPNPFNPSTVINYDVAGTGPVSLQVYNMLGQRIRTLFDGVRQAGSYSILWDGHNEKGEQVAAGIYFVRMKSDNLVFTRKMLLVK